MGGGVHDDTSPDTDPLQLLVQPTEMSRGAIPAPALVDADEDIGRSEDVHQIEECRIPVLLKKIRVVPVQTGYEDSRPFGKLNLVALESTQAQPEVRRLQDTP